MKFESYQKEIQHHRSQYEALERAAVREWPVVVDGKPMLIRASVTVYGPDFINPVSVHLGVSLWYEDAGASVTLEDGQVFTGGYFDFCHNPIDRLTSGQLRAVELARWAIEQWIDGHIPELPSRLPSQDPPIRPRL